MGNKPTIEEISYAVHEAIPLTEIMDNEITLRSIQVTLRNLSDGLHDKRNNVSNTIISYIPPKYKKCFGSELKYHCRLIMNK